MHRVTLKVLETIGVKVHHERALVLLRDACGGIRNSEAVKQKTLEIPASHKPKTRTPLRIPP
jgi:trimethylamine:corrinoid methyltransferase-like protein